MIRKSQTFKSLVRLLAQLPRRRKRALMRLIPLAILAGVADLVVVALPLPAARPVQEVDPAPDVPDWDLLRGVLPAFLPLRRTSRVL